MIDSLRKKFGSLQSSSRFVIILLFGGLSPIIVAVFALGIGRFLGKYIFLHFDKYSFGINELLFFLLIIILFMFVFWLRNATNISKESKTLNDYFFFALAIALFFVGILIMPWCFENHICAEGHMQHHPYPLWHYFVDLSWVACLAMAPLILKIRKNKLYFATLYLSIFAISFRFIWGSFGGIFGLPI